MKWSIENKIRAGFGLALGFLLLTSVVAFWSAVRSVRNFNSVERTERVLEQLANVMAAMVDVESGGRGFALTGQEQFLTPFDLGRRRAGEALVALRHTAADNPSQKKNL